MGEPGQTEAEPSNELAEHRRRVSELEGAEEDRAWLEERLCLDRQQLMSVFDSMGEPVYVSDPETYEMLYANDVLRERFGVVVGRKCYDVLQGLDSPCSFCTNKHLFGDSAVKNYIWEWQNRVDHRWYRCIDRAIRWPGGRMVRCEIAIDITDRVQAEERLRQSERNLRELAGGVGHELRHPLGVISNAIYYLQTTLASADKMTTDYLEIIASEVKRAGEIVSDLVDFAQTPEPDKEDTSVSGLVAEALETQPAPWSVEVITDLPAGLPPVLVDPRQIRHVLVNLLTNAYQAMPEGGRLTISAKSGRRHVQLSVADTGAGISPKDRERLFEPLFTTKSRGSGLGLAVSKRLVEVNGGRMSVKSKVGQGTTLTISLLRADG